MPLDPAAAAALIQAQLIPLPFVVPNADLASFCLAIATGMVVHITTSAVVVGTAAAVPGPGAPVVGTVT